MPNWQPLGDRAIRFARPRMRGVEPSTCVPARAIVGAVRAWPGVVDVVVAAEDVAAYFPDTADVADFAARIDERIAELVDLHETDEPVREHVLRVCYDGLDLDDVARATELSRDEVIAIHAGATYTVEMIGFAPGFAYLSGLDSRLELTRRATPRARVPAGSVAIAGQYSAVYSFESAGGWHLLGRVLGVTMFDARGPLLGLGDLVRFAVAERDDREHDA